MPGKKKEEKDNVSQTPIILNGEWLEKLFVVHPERQTLESLFNHNGWPPKIGWRLGRIWEKLEREGKIYSEQRQKIIDKYSQKHESDGSSKIAGQEVSHKQGDVKVAPSGQIMWLNKDAEQKAEQEMQALREDEIILPFWVINIGEDDINDEISPAEVKLLSPFVTSPELDKEFMVSDEEMERFKKEREKEKSDNEREKDKGA